MVSLGEEACAAWKGRCKDQLLARNETRLGEQLARLARAAAIMAGDDGCASSPEERAEVARGEACFTIGRRLAVDPEDVTWVSRHWLPTTMPARDEWRPYLDAWKDVTTWRARIDYATALLPVCVPSHARAGCEQITADADTAAPVQLAAILDELEDAFTRGSGCDPTALP
ncbi:MAG TPA: hypothetical protein VM734_07990 [Kofleriaceae bacterium]|nr:hypothetical protein [Kofleriaceae bacterium]